MSDVEVRSKWSTWLQNIGAMTSVLVAAGGAIAFLFSTPLDVKDFLQVQVFQHKITMVSPSTGSGVRPDNLGACGRAKLKSDWVLVVLVQSPAELKYYVASGGAITVRPDGRWTMKPTNLGSLGSKERATDKLYNYKVVALSLDALGQQQLQKALAAKTGFGALPHYAQRQNADVHLNDSEPSGSSKCDKFMAQP